MSRTQNIETSRTCVLSSTEYALCRDFIAERTGLIFSENRRADLEKGIAEGLARSGLATISEYLNALAANPTGNLMADLSNSLTVGETYFHRDTSQFDLLRREFLPKLIESRMLTTKSIRIWSAGCATGEEPYSLAILLHEMIPYVNTWNISILATDLNRESIAKAERGRYGRWSFRDVPETWLDKYFFVSGDSDFHLSDVIKEKVTFEYLNLKTRAYPSAATNTTDLDLIVCRNVMIYFDSRTSDEIMAAFHSSLAPGGRLLVGASDPPPPRELFRAQNFSGAFIYQKKSPGYEARSRKRSTHVNPVKETPKPSAVKKESAARQEPVKEIKTIDCLSECAALLELGQPEMAAEKLRRELENNPKSSETLLLMAKVEVARGDVRASERYALKTLELNKFDTRAYYLLSAICQNKDRDGEAIDCLRKALYLDPGFVVAHFTLACLYKKQGKTALARKSFQNAEKLMLGRDKDERVPESNGISYDKLLSIVEANLKQE